MARTTPSLVFFGSFLKYSAVILEDLATSDVVRVQAVVTTPPHPDSRSKKLIPTPVHAKAQHLGLPVLTPTTLDSESLSKLSDTISNAPDYLVTAGYGKLLPQEWLAFSSTAALNLHFSLLPSYRGANPAEWALLLGETTTGVTLIEMSEIFDTGAMLAQHQMKIKPVDTRESVYESLYQLGAETLANDISRYHLGKLSVQPQPTHSPTPHAQRFTRNDGFVHWELIKNCMDGQTHQPSKDNPGLSPLLFKAYQAWLQKDGVQHDMTSQMVFLERATRALQGFPSLWTLVETSKGQKRMKIMEVQIANQRLQLATVQVEGQQPAFWNQVKNGII